MRRTFALFVSLTLLAVASGIASADPYQRPAGNQRFIEQVINRALSQRGVPFSYGGGDSSGPTRGVARSVVPGLTSPALAPSPLFSPGATGLTLAPTTTPGLVDPNANVVGFDASGLVVYAFAGVGVKLPRSSGEMYKVGQKVAPSQALPGDLIFYGPEGTQSVALYLGNNQMIQGTDPVVEVTQVRAEGMTPYLVRIIA